MGVLGEVTRKHIANIIITTAGTLRFPSKLT